MGLMVQLKYEILLIKSVCKKYYENYKEKTNILDNNKLTFYPFILFAHNINLNNNTSIILKTELYALV